MEFKNHVSGFEKMGIDDLYNGIRDIFGVNRTYLKTGGDILRKINRDIRPIFDNLCKPEMRKILKAVKDSHCEIFHNSEEKFFKFLMILIIIDKDYIQELKLAIYGHLYKLRVSPSRNKNIITLIDQLEDKIEIIKNMIINIDPLSIMEIYKESVKKASKIIVGSSSKTLFDLIYEEYVKDFKQRAMSVTDKEIYIMSVLRQREMSVADKKIYKKEKLKKKAMSV